MNWTKINYAHVRNYQTEFLSEQNVLFLRINTEVFAEAKHVYFT